MNMIVLNVIRIYILLFFINFAVAGYLDIGDNTHIRYIALNKSIPKKTAISKMQFFVPRGYKATHIVISTNQYYKYVCNMDLEYVNDVGDTRTVGSRNYNDNCNHERHIYYEKKDNNIQSYNEEKRGVSQDTAKSGRGRMVKNNGYKLKVSQREIQKELSSNTSRLYDGNKISVTNLRTIKFYKNEEALVINAIQFLYNDGVIITVGRKYEVKSSPSISIELSSDSEIQGMVIDLAIKVLGLIITTTNNEDSFSIGGVPSRLLGPYRGFNVAVPRRASATTMCLRISKEGNIIDSIRLSWFRDIILYYATYYSKYFSCKFDYSVNNYYGIIEAGIIRGSRSWASNKNYNTFEIDLTQAKSLELQYNIETESLTQITITDQKMHRTNYGHSCDGDSCSTKTVWLGPTKSIHGMYGYSVPRMLFKGTEYPGRINKLGFYIKNQMLHTGYGGVDGKSFYDRVREGKHINDNNTCLEFVYDNKQIFGIRMTVAGLEYPWHGKHLADLKKGEELEKICDIKKAIIYYSTTGSGEIKGIRFTNSITQDYDIGQIGGRDNIQKVIIQDFANLSLRGISGRIHEKKLTNIDFDFCKERIPYNSKRCWKTN